MTTKQIDRREFVRLTALAGGGMLLAVTFPKRARGPLATVASASAEPFTPNAWIKLDPNGDITLLSHKSEMGQGVWTALPMIIAEEMDADWTRVRIERAPVMPPFDGTTGGSDSVATSWQTLRQAGALARALLVTAAAQRWGVPENECVTFSSEVRHEKTGRAISYGALAAAAAASPVPDMKTITLKDPSTFRLVGTDTARRDTPSKVTGKATFGIDVRVPGMLVACVARCPTFKGRVLQVDDRKAKAIPGVRHVIVLDPVPPNHPGRVAVLADDTWSAIAGRNALAIEWDYGDGATFSTDAMWTDARSRVYADDQAKLVRKQGRIDDAVAGSHRTVEAIYELPFLAHACMEPMNGTASVTADKVELWLPTQFPDRAQAVASQLTGLPKEKVEVHVTFLGGGFGRRAYQDFVIEAVELSQKAGAPVKVFWTREDDIQHDMYRPAQLQRFRAELDAVGTPVRWFNRVVGPSGEAWWNPTTTEPWRRERGEAPPYNIDNLLVDFVQLPAPVPLGAWRAVQNGSNGFCFESFIDECAHAAGADPVAYRSMLLSGKPRQLEVLQLAASKAGWGTKLAKGRGRGVAFFNYGGTYVAQVAEVAVGTRGDIRVDRVVCAFDCGTIINPNIVRQQIESAVVWGVSAALHGEITMTNGRTQQSNFHNYPVLQMKDAPVVETYLVRNLEEPTGVGEPAVPPIAAAVANAIFDATGKRLRRIPLRLT